MTVLISQPARSSLIRPPVVTAINVAAPLQATRLIAAVLETMLGRRSLHQLRPHLAIAAFHQLTEYVDSARFRQAQLGGVRTQMPTVRAVEASARLACPERWLSCVLRLDADERVWRCTDLAVLEPRVGGMR